MMRLVVLPGIRMAAIAAAGCGGGGRDANVVDQKTFDAAVKSLREAVQHAEEGDTAAAERSFGEMHAFNHRLDSELRRQGVDVTLTGDAAQAVIDMETTRAGRRDPALFARQGRRLLELMARSANALGYRAATAAPKLPDTLQSVLGATRGAA